VIAEPSEEKMVSDACTKKLNSIMRDLVCDDIKVSI